MGVVYLNQVEREWISRHLTGVTAQTPLNQLRRRYWSETIGGDQSRQGMGDLEIVWLKTYITANGGTPSASNYPSTLWREAVVTIGQTPSKYINENKIKFYINAT